MSGISRRKFAVLTAASAAAVASSLRAMAGPTSQSSSHLSAQEVVGRIRETVGTAWKPDTADGFKAGDPNTVVTGIATTSLASLAMLQRAASRGANLIITCEPTFYSHADTPTPPVPHFGPPGAAEPVAPPRPPDPVFQAKQAFLKQHGMVVWRFSENWRLHRPDPFVQGLADVLGWSNVGQAVQPGLVTIPETSLGDLVEHVKTALKSRGGMRIVGDPKLRVRRVALLPGSTAIAMSLATLPGVDAMVAGEMREWEGVEYVRDVAAMGGQKSLLLVGRIVSEDPGMKVCAEWLRTVVPEVQSTWVPVEDPYWRPTL